MTEEQEEDKDTALAHLSSWPAPPPSPVQIVWRILEIKKLSYAITRLCRKTQLLSAKINVH